jgi:hypothetical protein
MNYDHWKSTEPRRDAAHRTKYHCMDCTWRGRSVDAFDHHKAEHHRLMLPNGLEAIFSCCDHEATGMPLVARKDGRHDPARLLRGESDGGHCGRSR